ncbi:MAG: 2-amino-4-hydroxy-6-hydroxymethyldihydropteridine diphosphokinase [Gemmatimonadaceae bacterium]
MAEASGVLAYVALGSNLGDRVAHLAQARVALSLVRASRIVAFSSIEETAPLGGMTQPPYLNQMAALRTTLHPVALLHALHRIELALGRVRAARWAPRTIDLDIVLHGDRTMSSTTLVLPHPGLEHRDFWQRELAELATLLRRAA